MKTAKEFFERLQNDEAFAQEVNELVKGKLEAGQTDYKEIWIPIAAEYGYEIKAEALDEAYSKVSEELTDEELGKVSGGTTPLIVVTSIISTEILATLSIAITIETNSGDLPPSDPGVFN